jgi:hypothetical protein
MPSAAAARSTRRAQRAARCGKNGRRAHQLVHRGDHVRLQQRPVPQRVYPDAGRHGGVGEGPLDVEEAHELDRGGGERRADGLAAGVQPADDVVVLHDEHGYDTGLWVRWEARKGRPDRDLERPERHCGELLLK